MESSGDISRCTEPTRHNQLIDCDTHGYAAPPLAPASPFPWESFSVRGRVGMRSSLSHTHREKALCLCEYRVAILSGCCFVPTPIPAFLSLLQHRYYPRKGDWPHKKRGRETPRGEHTGILLGVLPMVLHIYHVSVGEQEFEFMLDLNTSSQAAMQADLQATLDEVSPSMLKHVQEAAAGGSTLMCESCHTSPAARLLHHLLFFTDAAPPRVEDIPSVVCMAARCEKESNDQHQRELREAGVGM